MYNDSRKLLMGNSERNLQSKSKTLLLSTTAVMVGALLVSDTAGAQSVNDNSWNYDTVLDGNVTKDVSVDKITDITVSGGNGFVEGNADIKAGHTVNVEGLDGARTFAYRDNRDNITSTLSGNLSSNIQVVIIDKDGLFFTSLSQIDVQGLIATSADVAVADIMDGGTLVLDNVGDGGAVVIDGSITVAEAGLAAFVSPFISNNGLIKAKLGNVVMAAGETVTLDMYGDGLVEVAVDGELADALIANVGEIKAAGGFVQITAKAAKGTLDNLINNEGLITVSSAEVQGGKIILSGGNNGTVNNDGVLRTSEGGSVDISGERFEQGDAAPLFAAAAIVEEDAPIPPRKPAIRGGDITIETDGSVEIYEGKINARGGDINIDNGGSFYSAKANTLKTEGNGTITLNQSMGLVLPALKLSSIQNAVDAVDNSGDGQNTINVSAGVYIESIDVDHDNMTLNGANAGVSGDSDARGAETIILPGSPAFNVTSDNVTIDGFSIIGDGAGNDIGVNVDSADDVTVSNNTMIGVDYGVLADNADYLNVSDNKIDLALVDAIHVDSSDHIRIAGNVINGTAVDGIKVSGGHGATIRGNEINDSGDDGIDVHDNNRAIISGNTVDTTGLDNSDGNGIHLVNSGRARIVNNTIVGAGDDGIDVEGSNNVKIIRNRVRGSGDDGIDVESSNNALIRNNRVRNSEDDGIEVRGGDLVRILNNTISEAGDDGIDVEGTEVSNIRNNTISDIDDDGISVDDFGSSWIAYNDISDVGDDGIDVDGGDFVSIYDNWITRVGEAGIHVGGISGLDREFPFGEGFGFGYYGSDAEIFDNTVTFAGEDGVYVHNTSSVYIADNNIGHIQDDGIDVHDTELSYIVGNVVSMTGDNGIGVDGGAYAGIFDNKILLTGDQGIDIDHVNWGFDGPLVALGNRDYGYGWAVNIAGNEVAFTGTTGIEVQESGATRISNNDVIFAGMGHELSHLIDNINDRALDSVADDAPRRIEISRELILEDYEPSFSWAWGDGDGIHVDDTYGYGPGGWAVKIDNNRVARTGGDGIEVHDAGRTMIDTNVVRYAGIDETEWSGYRSLGSLLNSGPFASEGRRNLWGEQNMNDVIRDFVPRPDYIGWSDNDGIRAENINNELFDERRILAAPAFSGQVKEGGRGYYEYDLVITNNKIRKTGDDGIDVNGAGRTLIGWNNIRNIGGYLSEGDLYRFDDEFEYEFEGADGIHVDNVYGNGRFDLVGEGEYGYRGYAVDVIGNNINRTNDDGIEIVDSGSAYIADNIVRNAGFGRGEDYGGSDYYGADGIHVRNVYGEGFGPGILGVDYAVVISGNRVRTTGDDGIEVNGAGRTLIDNNRVRNAGYAGGRNYRSGDRFGADGIAVSGVFAREFYDYEGEGEGREFRVSPNYANLGYSVIITDNNVRNTGDDGIEVTRSGSALIDDNYVDNAMGDGIFVEGPRKRLIGPILLQASEVSFGIYDDGFGKGSRYRTVITNNEVTHSGNDGIHAIDIPDLTISDNEVSESGEHGVYVGGAFNGDVEFQGNTLIDNGVEEEVAQARFESGDIDMSDLARPNIFINTTGTASTALQFDDVYRPFGDDGDSVVLLRNFFGGGNGLRIVNETLGSTRFSGYAPNGSYYVRFEDGSILDPISGAPIVISGMNASFDGIVPNSFLGGILPSPVLSFIEDRLYDADDNTVNGRGQIFVGSAPLPGLGNIQDFFRNFRFGGGTSGGAILTINGLPSIGGGAGGLNNINPAAGEGGEEGSEFAGISPAAGGDEGEAREVTCVADALSSIGSGSVTYKFGGTFEDGIASESRCASTNI